MHQLTIDIKANCMCQTWGRFSFLRLHENTIPGRGWMDEQNKLIEAGGNISTTSLLHGFSLLHMVHPTDPE